VAKVKEIYVEASFTKNLGNYQNFRPTAGVTITLEDGDTIEDVYKKAWDLVGEQVEEQLKLFEEDQRARR
jgi:hypothetical protein